MLKQVQASCVHSPVCGEVLSKDRHIIWSSFPSNYHECLVFSLLAYFSCLNDRLLEGGGGERIKLCLIMIKKKKKNLTLRLTHDKY